MNTEVQTPEAIKKHSREYKSRSWTDYSMVELAFFAINLANRATHRNAFANDAIAKDIYDAYNYLAMFESKAEDILDGRLGVNPTRSSNGYTGDLSTFKTIVNRDVVEMFNVEQKAMNGGLLAVSDRLKIRNAFAQTTRFVCDVEKKFENQGPVINALDALRQ